MPSIDAVREYRRTPVVLAVLAVVAALAAIAREPSPPADLVSSLASRFKFDVQKLPAVPVPADVQYGVNKNATHMLFYYYQVGESVALGDLDGDGVANDICQTDVRAKHAMLSTVPGTGSRFASLVLDFGDRVNTRISYPSVCRIADMNEDGLSDLFIAFYGRTPLLLLRKAPEGLQAGAPLTMDSFAIAELVPQKEIWWSATATFADFDGDGHQDLYLGNYYADGSELMDPDSDKPFEMNEDFSRAKNGGTSRMFLHVSATTGDNPTVHFHEVKKVLAGEGNRAWTLAVGAADLDRDGLSDLYISNDFGPDQLLMNKSTPGRIKFEELKGRSGFDIPTSLSVGNDTFKSMSIDFADLNNDGVFDMYVSNIASPFRLQEGHFLWMSTPNAAAEMKAGVAPWKESAEDLKVAHSAWAWDARFEDFDNDGTMEIVQATGLTRGRENRWPDLAQIGGANDAFVKHPANWPKFLPGVTDVDGSFQNPFWVRGADGKYVDLAATLFPGVTEPARGLAIADVDQDGFPEQVYSNFWMESTYIKNTTRNGNKHLGLHLLLPVSASASNQITVHDGHPTFRQGTPAIGAFVEVELPTGQKLIRQVDGGNGHSGQRSPELLFGLGQVTNAPLPVHVTWRDLTGAAHRDTLQITPGKHTIVLATKGSN